MVLQVKKVYKRNEEAAPAFYDLRGISYTGVQYLAGVDGGAGHFGVCKSR